MKEVEKLTQFSLAQAKLSPQLEFKKISHQKIGNQDLYEIVVIVQNQGFLPTHGTAQWHNLKQLQRPNYRLTLAKGQKIIQGKEWSEVTHLTGRSASLPFNSPLWFFSDNTHELRTSWIIHGSGELTLDFDFQIGRRNSACQDSNLDVGTVSAR